MRACAHWFEVAPAEAEGPDANTRDGHLDWLLELAARRMPTGGKKGGVSEWTGVDGGDQDWLLDFASRTVPEAQTSTATVTRKRTIRR